MNNPRIYTVSQVNAYIRGILEDDILLSEIELKGELSNVKYHSSGHIYFTVKDSRSQIPGVMFSSDARTLKFTLKEGLAVVISGRIGLYERDGRYQIYAKRVAMEGAGELYEKYEKLKRRLEEMGMFDAMYKQPIPKYINRLGVVTAPTGAAVRDIINIALRRNPYLEIILFPAKVQGNGAAESLVQGIRALSRLNIDTIIIGRGGGSIEDLWAFNEEIVARAIFDCPIPIISGTGHETDTTIADWVADLRAPTPSAAAELAVFDYQGFAQTIKNYKEKLFLVIQDRIDDERDHLREMGLRLSRYAPEQRLKQQKSNIASSLKALTDAMRRRLEDSKLQLMRNEDSLKSLMERRLENRRSLMALYAERLNGLSPLNTLSRGYTFAETKDGRAFKDINSVKAGDRLNIYVKNGKAAADIISTEEFSYAGQ